VNLLPLFPLDLVLLPGTALPLHIFEPRYREMTAECLAQNKPFGVVRTKEQGIFEIGCTADMVEMVKQYPDGRSDIVVRGVQRFEIMRVDQERAFLQAEVFLLNDDPSVPPAGDAARAIKLHAELMSLARAKAEEVTASKQLSFLLAGSLPLDLDFKQSLLEMKSEADRLGALITYFETILPSIKRSVQVRHKASGNGHGI
jgi:uncharacterized protein